MAFGLALLACIPVLASLTLDHVTLNIGYRLWKNDLFPYTEKNKIIFSHDYGYHHSFAGRPLEKLEKKFPNLIDSSSFPFNSYRVQATYFTKTEGIIYLWFDDRADEFGLCVEVKDGTIKRIAPIKG